MARTITRKISLSGAKISDVTKAGGRLFVGRVAGLATGIKENIHPQYGLSIGLIGAFRAKMGTGEELSAPVLWGPGVLTEPVASALKTKAESVTIQADVYAVASDTSPVGYVYVLETHADEASDPVAALINSMPTLSLPAPAPATKKGK